MKKLLQVWTLSYLHLIAQGQILKYGTDWQYGT